MTYQRKSDLGWTLVLTQDYQEAYGSLLRVSRVAQLLLVVSIIASIISAYLLSKRLTQPVQELSAIAEEISRGQLSANIQGTQRKDEIGTIARSLERLKNSIDIALRKMK